MTPEQCAQATIDRLALELAKERTAHAGTREELASVRRSARTWRRVAEWIYGSHEPPTRLGKDDT